MKIIAIINCGNCGTFKEVELKSGHNVVRGCHCPYPYGDEGGIVEVKTDKS